MEAYWYLGSGQLIFGFENGVYLFNSQLLRSNPFVPEVLFSDVKIGNQLIGPADGRRLSTSFSTSEKIEFHYDDRSIQFEFASTYLGKPDQNTLTYQLEGLTYERTMSSEGHVTYSTKTRKLCL